MIELSFADEHEFFNWTYKLTCGCDDTSDG
jgi:hypothetical protein